MRNFFEPTASPPWLRQVLSSIRAALGDIWPAPLRLKDYAGADLPAAADFAQGLVWDATALRLAVSDGAAWIGLQPWDATLAALAGLDAAAGILVETAADSFAKRSLAAPAAGLTIANPAGIAGNPTFALANDLAAVEGLAGAGLAARTGTDAWAVRTLTGPAAGISVSNGSGAGGNPTLALANDLAALEALSGTNTIYYRSGTDAWSAVAIGGLLAFSGGTLNIGATTGSGSTVVLSAAPVLAGPVGIGGTAASFDLEIFNTSANMAMRSSGTAPAAFRGYVNGAEAGKVSFLNGGGVEIESAGTQVLIVKSLGNYANDAAASAGGVAVKQMYRNGSVLMIRVS